MLKICPIIFYALTGIAREPRTLRQVACLHLLAREPRALRHAARCPYGAVLRFPDFGLFDIRLFKSETFLLIYYFEDKSEQEGCHAE